MKVTVTARHARFSDRIRKYALDKAQHLEHYFDHLRKLEVILDLDGDTGYGAEMIASAVRGNILVCHSVESTAMAAIDGVVGRMERQLVRFKEKLYSKHGHHGASRPGKPNGGRQPVAIREGLGDVWW
jgi:ribosome hibernation promoting factor